MTQCWSEGELRAYLDGELPAGDMQRLAAHLAACPVCSGRQAELEQRAAWMSRSLAALPEPEPVVQIPRLVARSQTNWRWAAAIAAAAALAAAFLMLPRRTDRMVVAPTISVPPSVPAVSAPPIEGKPEMIRQLARKQATPVRPRPQVQSYVALDNEPIESGVVVRMGLNGGQVPADVIFGPDGRPRAIRLVSDSSGER